MKLFKCLRLHVHLYRCMYLAPVNLHDFEYNLLQVFNIWQNVDLNKI